MARCRNIKLGDFRQYQNMRNIFKKKNMGHNGFQKRSNSQNFKLGNFTLSWSKEGQVASVRPYITYSIELQQKMKMLDKLV